MSAGTLTRIPLTRCITLYYAPSPWSDDLARTPHVFEVLGMPPGKNAKVPRWNVEVVYVRPPLPEFMRQSRKSGHGELLDILRGVLAKELGMEVGSLTWDKITDAPSK